MEGGDASGKGKYYIVSSILLPPYLLKAGLIVSLYWFWLDLSYSVRTPIEKTQQRLAELEQSEETVAKETLQLTQKVSTFFPLVFSFSFSSLF